MEMTKILTRSVSRRSVLKGGAAIAGATAVTGFPTVWAQNIKDVTLVHTGMSYSTIADIARQASQDLGFKVEMSVVDHPGLTNRMVTIRARSTSPTWKSGRPRSPCRRA
jgi:putative spermidine/putrescine transport system substrate-binding protein